MRAAVHMSGVRSMFARGANSSSNSGPRTPTTCARPLPRSTVLPTIAGSLPKRRFQSPLLMIAITGRRGGGGSPPPRGALGPPSPPTKTPPATEPPPRNLNDAHPAHPHTPSPTSPPFSPTAPPPPPPHTPPL